MNVLNPTYFTVTDRLKVASNIHAGLRLGGWLVIGSNQDAGSQVHGGIYRRTGVGFEKVWQSGEGSRFEAVLLGHRAVEEERA